MPDSFFAANKPRKRKRSTPGNGASPRLSPKKIPRIGGSAGHTKARGSDSFRNAGNINGAQIRKRKVTDEELDSDATDGEDGGGIKDMDLKMGSDPEGSSEEDEDETPAEKRLRLAKLYLESVKEGLGILTSLISL